MHNYVVRVKQSLTMHLSVDNTKFMPQLDLLTFFTQFFWAILCLFLFYFFVSKLILPELTRVLKYRSKASALSGAGDRPDAVSHAGQEGGGDTLSQSSEKSGSSTLYQYAIGNSARVLTEARKKRDTFLDNVTSSKTVSATGERSVSTNSTDSYSSLSSSDREAVKSGKPNKHNLSEEGSKTPLKSSKSSKSSGAGESTKRSESAKGSKSLKSSKNLSRDFRNSKGGDASKS